MNLPLTRKVIDHINKRLTESREHIRTLRSLITTSLTGDTQIELLTKLDEATVPMDDGVDWLRTLRSEE